jgi:NADH-quinone oxidoreductase subunit L
VFEHAHESPRVMVGPLVVLAVCAVVAGWNLPLSQLGLEPILEQARPAATAEGMAGGPLLPAVDVPAEHTSHAPRVHQLSTLVAFTMALIGFLLATFFYGLRKLDPADVRRQFAPIYDLLIHKWWFDELYQAVFVRPALRLARWAAAVDRRAIDWLADGLARLTAAVARLDDWFDRLFVDNAVNLVAAWTYGFGLRLRRVQTGNLRQYVMWLAVGAVGLFVLVSLYWNYAVAGQ